MKNENTKVVVFLIFASLLVLIPVAWMISTSLKTIDNTFSMPPTLLPDKPVLDAYISIWIKYPYARYLNNSVIIVILSTVISVFFSTMAGFGLSRFKFKGAASFTTFLLLTQMFPSVLLLIPTFQILKIYGLINTHLGLILVYMGLRIPLCTWIMMGYFNSIPKELDEAAAIDGLSAFQIFFKIAVPLALPGIASTSIYALFESWNEYLFALILTTSNKMLTLPVGIGQLVGQYNVQWNELMAASLTGSLPLLFIFFFLQKYLISGMTAGAVKQ